MHLSLLIPACNERQRIAPALEGYATATEAMDCEILVLVNGTRDGTEDLIASAFLPRYPHLRLIVIPEAVGKGGALIRGMCEARGDLIAYVDADGPPPPAHSWICSGTTAAMKFLSPPAGFPEVKSPLRHPASAAWARAASIASSGCYSVYVSPTPNAGPK